MIDDSRAIMKYFEWIWKKLLSTDSYQQKTNKVQIWLTSELVWDRFHFQLHQPRQSFLAGIFQRENPNLIIARILEASYCHLELVFSST